MAVTRLLNHLLSARIQSLPWISHSYLLECFSTLAKDESNINPINKAHSRNLFAEFAGKKFNLSAVDISRIFKNVPSLQNLETLKNVEVFVDMLSRHGLTHNQIAEIMMKQPTVMKVSAERLLEPKLRFLKDFGIQMEDLASMLVRRPRILSVSLENNLQPTMAFLKDVFQNKDLLIKALLRNPIILVRNLEKTLKPSFAFWEGFGLNGKELSKLLLLYPSLLLFSSLTPAKAELMSKIGMATDSKMFKYILTMVVKTRMETLESKVHNLQQCGLTAEETMELFRISPYAFGFSKEKVRQNMDFIVNNMELPANSVLKDSHLLHRSLDKVLKPRFLVWQKLKSIGGDINIKSFSTVLRMSEASFVGKIVKGHPESAILCAIYQEALADASSTTNISRKV